MLLVLFSSYPNAPWLSASCPSASSPSSSCPSASCPSASCPSASCPSASCPMPSILVINFQLLYIPCFKPSLHIPPLHDAVLHVPALHVSVLHFFHFCWSVVMLFLVAPGCDQYWPVLEHLCDWISRHWVRNIWLIDISEYLCDWVSLSRKHLVDQHLSFSEYFGDCLTEFHWVRNVRSARLNKIVVKGSFQTFISPFFLLLSFYFQHLPIFLSRLVGGDGNRSVWGLEVGISWRGSVWLDNVWKCVRGIVRVCRVTENSVWGVIVRRGTWNEGMKHVKERLLMVDTHWRKVGKEASN